MKKSLGKRVVTEHCPISHVVSALPLVNLVILASINSRTYKITVPWNSGCIEIARIFKSVFPKIDNVSLDFVCKRVEAEIEGEKGFYYGSVSKQTNQPQGEGVFVA